MQAGAAGCGSGEACAPVPGARRSKEPHMRDLSIITPAACNRCPILVTGGAGYIGSNVALALLDEGRPVVVLDDMSTGSAMLLPEGAQLVEGKAGDRALVERLVRGQGIEAVVHLAASISVEESIREPGLY